MYINKVGFNQEMHHCVVKLESKYPQLYTERSTLEKYAEEISGEDVTQQYKDIIFVDAIILSFRLLFVINMLIKWFRNESIIESLISFEFQHIIFCICIFVEDLEIYDSY